MKLTLHYTGQLAAHAGTSEETLTLEPGAALLPLLRDLATERGPDFAKFLLDAEGQPVPTLVVALDGAQITLDESAVLNADAKLTLLTPMAGG